MIEDFVAQHGRVPTQMEFSAAKGWVHPSTVVAHFPSWNAALKEAGFSPNPATIGCICSAKDGHLCRSKAELIIDDWLFDRKIVHEKEVRYPQCNLLADWRVGSVFVEYLGIDVNNDNRVSREYARTLVRKRRICAEHGILLIELNAWMLNDLRKAFGFVTK